LIRDSILWLVVLTGPLVWMLSFGAVFALSGWTCTWNSKLALYLVSCAALLLTESAGVAAFGQWRAIGKEWPGESGGAVSRARAMAIAGIALNLMFFVVIIGQSIPQLLLVGCE
jgi:hypothetical protein